MPSFTLADLAARTGGRIVGDGQLAITGVADPAHARAGELVFWIQEGYAEAIARSAAAAVVVAEPVPDFDRPQLVVPNVRLAMTVVMPLFERPQPFTGIDPSAVIDPTAQIAPTAAIGPLVAVGAHAVIGEGTLLYPGVVVGRHVTVGRDCKLYPRVVLYDDVHLGDRVILHAGTVVGSDGYGFTPDAQGHHRKIPQLGTVVIGSDVECGANVAIDRATFGETVIGDGTKLDNLVHIGHNDRIGKDCLIVSQVGISGSVTVGDHVTLAGQVGVAGHLTIGDQAVVLARAGVTKDVPAKTMVSGFPARPHKEEMRRQAALGAIEGLRRELAELKRALTSVPELHGMEEQPYDH